MNASLSSRAADPLTRESTADSLGFGLHARGNEGLDILVHRPCMRQSLADALLDDFATKGILLHLNEIHNDTRSRSNNNAESQTPNRSSQTRAGHVADWMKEPQQASTMTNAV